MSGKQTLAKEEITAIRRNLVDLIIDKDVSVRTEEGDDLILRTQDALVAIDYAFGFEIKAERLSPALQAAIAKINQRTRGI